MMLTKGKRKHELKQRIDEIRRVHVLSDYQMYTSSMPLRLSLIHITMHAMRDLIEKDDTVSSSPQYFTLANYKNKQTLFIYPRPDKNYECKVLGSVFIEQ